MEATIRAKVKALCNRIGQGYTDDKDTAQEGDWYLNIDVNSNDEHYSIFRKHSTSNCPQMVSLRLRAEAFNITLDIADSVLTQYNENMQ